MDTEKVNHLDELRAMLLRLLASTYEWTDVQAELTERGTSAGTEKILHILLANRQTVRKE